MGIILSFILLVDRFRLRIMRMVGLVDIYQNGMAGIRRYNEIMEFEDRKDGFLELNERIKTIVFDGVGFKYRDKTILKNINLEIERGDRVAFVGKSGIGKTTTVSLLKRASLVTEGKILINGIPIEDITYKSYLNRVGIVEQNDYIINDSIIDNITIVKESFSEDSLNKALQKSYTNEIFEKFEKKERSEIGEGGIYISSGQKQKIAIARLFLKSPDIINEKAILKNIKEEFSDKIIIAITHRLGILKDFNKIYLLDNETIIENGNFQELIEKKGEFYKLYHGIKEK